MHPVLLTLRFGSIEVVLGAYSTFYLLAWVGAPALGTVIAWRGGVPWRRALLLYVVALGIGIIGARLLDVATNWGAYAHSPRLVYSLDVHGFSLYGGLILAIAAGALLARPLRLPLWRLADGAVPAMAAAIVLMRTGCFLQGCCFGTVTSLPWGVTFPTGSPAWSYQLVSGQTGVLAFAGLVRPVHPTQIYESMAALVCCAVALSLKPRRRPTGSSEAAGTPDRRRSVAGLPFLVFALGFTLFRVAEFFLRPRPLTATGPGWLYPALYAVIIVTVVAVLVRRTANGHDQGI